MSRICQFKQSIAPEKAKSSAVGLAEKQLVFAASRKIWALWHVVISLKVAHPI